MKLNEPQLKLNEASRDMCIGTGGGMEKPFCYNRRELYTMAQHRAM